MKRLILIALLLLGGSALAHADSSVWTAKTPRSDDELATAVSSCNDQVGPEVSGLPTTTQYKACMHRQGWIYAGTTVHPPNNNYIWISRHGKKCHPILNGFGSECSSF